MSTVKRQCRPFRIPLKALEQIKERGPLPAMRADIDFARDPLSCAGEPGNLQKRANWMGTTSWVQPSRWCARISVFGCSGQKQFPEPRRRQRRGGVPLRRYVSVPIDESLHFFGHRVGDSGDDHSAIRMSAQYNRLVSCIQKADGLSHCVERFAAGAACSPRPLRVTLRTMCRSREGAV